MKFAEAYKIAMNSSAKFRAHDANVNRAIAAGISSPCMVFAINDETFYYGFDGVDVLKGKHTPYRATVLINRGDAFIIA